MSNGSPFTACVSGSVEGRTFSLHAETVKGVSVNDFVQVNATVPRVTSLPFCWSALITLPNATLPPETLLVHVWDYQNAYTSNVTTLLLYSLSVKIVNATSTPSNDILGYPVSTWLTFTSIGAAALAVALVVYGVLRSRRRRESRSSNGAAGFFGGSLRRGRLGITSGVSRTVDPAVGTNRLSRPPRSTTATTMTISSSRVSPRGTDGGGDGQRFRKGG